MLACCLTNSIISFYLSYLSSFYKIEAHDILLVDPTDSIILADGRHPEFMNDILESCKLSNKRLVLFIVYDCDEGYCGYHWSTLVYDRTKNAFFHLDSVQGVNNDAAEKLYNAVKSYMGPGGEVSRPQTSSSKYQRKKKKKKKNSWVAKPKPEVVAITTPVAGLPIFKECQITQQTNGYDCGVYVLAIAKALCEHGRDSETDALSAITTYVDNSVEFTMRKEVLDISRGSRKGS